MQMPRHIKSAALEGQHEEADGKVKSTVEEVASAVVFLASPAALVTGSSLLADGGWTAW
jgi:NAD(P)-dependent dehydrogenase (short-subunit alcohol dehydrogenase family)